MPAWRKPSKVLKTQDDRQMSRVDAAKHQMDIDQTMSDIGAPGNEDEKRLSKSRYKFAKAATQQRQSIDRAKNAGGPSIGKRYAKMRVGRGN